VVTPDLLAYRPDAALVPTLIDTDHFTPGPQSDKTLVSLVKPTDRKLIPPDLRTAVVHIRSDNPIQYRNMPAFLRQYGRLANPKGHDDVFSGLELQALAAGLKVIKSGKIITTLPPACRPKNVINALMEIIEKK